MNGNEEEQLPRTRPLSGGIWTLFSWLRRSERSSSESISSIGSDRSVASFDFLGPTEYGISGPPLILPATDPTNTYNNRLREREIRRQHDSDITIHRKYGLIRFAGYETHTLPSTSHIKSISHQNNEYPRQRRATSESYRRRTAYVPGKRRAPQPPSPVGAATLPRYKRKRPAPKPPNVIIESNKENYEHKITIQMNKQKSDTNDLHMFLNGAMSSHKKHEYAKVHEKDSKETKSFLKQLFENRKCNSSVDTSHVKFLPSISELDKQALEIIETKKALKASKGNVNSSKSQTENPWICTKCLRKYQASVLVCFHCQTLQGSIHTNTNISIVNQTNKNKCNEQEKLKEMLKEMKNSLPKRSKGDRDNKTWVTESSTLRIGDNNNTEQGASTNMISNKCKVKELFLSPGVEANDEESKTITITKITSNRASNSANNVHDAVQVMHNGAINKITVEKESPHRSDLKTSRVSVSLKSGEPNICKPSISASPAVNKNVVIDNQKKKIKLQSSSVLNQLNVTNNGMGAKQHSNIVIDESPKSVDTNSDKTKNCNTPLRISTLLNPVEVDNKNIKEHFFERRENSLKNTNVEKDLLLPTNKEDKPISITNPENIHSIKTTVCLPVEDKANSKIPLKRNLPYTTSSNSYKHLEDKKELKNEVKINDTQKNDETKIPTTSVNSNLPSSRRHEIGNFLNNNLEILNHHSRRRNLVNQLEQSIAKGDAKTAAEAAAEMAKLRLSCSVLSFSSQIIAESLPVIFNNNEISSPSLSSLKSNIKKTSQNEKVDEIVVKASTSTASEISINNSQPPSNEARKHETGVQAGPSASSFAKKTEDLCPIQVWIEDKKTARGPVRINIRRNALMVDLMRHAETSLGLPINLQRWIVGKNLCTDDKIPISKLAGADFSAPFYLCLVEPGTKENGIGVQIKPVNVVAEEKPNENTVVKCGDVYKELMNLEREAIVPNSEPFECEVCMEQCAPGEGVVLRECIHIFCRNCLSDAIRHCQEAVVSCPAVNCSGSLQEREIRALLTLEEYERWLTRSLVTAECGTRNTFHCRTADCKGWAFCEPEVQKFPCPVCKHTNCIPCQALHEGETCEQYQEKLKKAVSFTENNQVDEGTQSFLNSLIRRGEALKCPECDAIITKKWGCDWVKCSACKTEICWVTKGRRWGPAGKGDTSGGCRCGVDGKRCHPTCGYCH